MTPDPAARPEYGVTLEGWLQQMAGRLRYVYAQGNPRLVEMFVGFATDVDTAAEMARAEKGA